MARRWRRVAPGRAIIGPVSEQRDLPAEAPQVVVVREPNWGTKIVLVLITVVLLALAALLAVTWLPRWWAQRVGGVVDGAISTGVFAGLTCGVVFTAIPLLLLRRVFAWHRGGVTSRVVWLLLAAVVAAPNLTTLAIVLGNGNAAHAAERTLDVEAPAFRTSTAVGAGIGVAAVLLWWMLLAGGRRRRRQLEQLKAEVRDRDDRLLERERERAAEVADESKPVDEGDSEP